MPRPDVALVAPYPSLGLRHAGFSGVASYTANLAEALDAAGADVTVVAPVEAGEPRESRDGRVRVQRCFARGATALPRAARAAAATGAPVVHFQHETFLWGGPSALPGLIPALARRRPASVVTMHQVVDPAEVDGDYVRMHRVDVPAPAARLAITGLQATIRRLAGRTVVHEPSFARILGGATVIPHGVERRLTPDKATARSQLELDGGAFVVLCFGFVAPYKGLEIALRAAELAGPAVQLVVAGGEHPRLGAGGDDYGRRLEARWGAAARFTGWVPEHEVAAWFAAADLALFPYPRPFASSGALALALAHGTPVLVSEALARSAGLPLELAVPAEPLALAARLLALAGDETGRNALAAAVAGLAGERAWPLVAGRHLQVYEEVTHADAAARRRIRTAEPG